MKKVIKILIFTIIVFGLTLGNTTNILAVNGLQIKHHGVLLSGNPIFEINNMLPGDQATETIEVKNLGSKAVLLSIKGNKTNGSSEDPLLEPILDFKITSDHDLFGGTMGAKSLADFFTQSQSPDGIPLQIIAPNQTVLLTFTAFFPTSADNNYQKKFVVFDLIFGVVTSDNLVINEVYYKVDSSHGQDSPKDRGVGSGAVISGNGAGSINIINLKIKNTCIVVQKNTTNAQTNISGGSSTGGNSASGNTGGITILKIGNATISVNVTTVGGNNTVNCGLCCQNNGQNDEWIEIYNPTSGDISLKNWVLVDNSGNSTIINPNKSIKAGGFALIAKDASMWKYWNANPNAIKVELGQQIGDGLDNSGDHLILKNPQGIEVDYVAWGGDNFRKPIWESPSNPSAPNGGSSIERLVPGFDTNLPTDWLTRTPPTPGN